MGDITRQHQDLITLWKDMGDGTHSQVFYIGGGTIVVTDGGTALSVTTDGAYEVARNGDPLCRWVNDKTGIAALTVLTDGPAGNQPGIYYNLLVGETVYIAQFCYELHTINDDLRVEYGYTDQVNGAGTFYPCTPVFRVATGAGNSGFVAPYKEISPPIPIRYANGARSITARVQANNANAQAMLAWHGFREGA